MSYAPPTTGRQDRVIICGDHASERRFNRQQVREQLDLINPSMVVFASEGRLNNHVRQYAQERRITCVEYSEVHEQTMQNVYPALVVVFPGGAKSAEQVKAARRNNFPVYVVGR